MPSGKYTGLTSSRITHVLTYDLIVKKGRVIDPLQGSTLQLKSNDQYVEGKERFKIH